MIAINHPVFEPTVSLFVVMIPNTGDNMQMTQQSPFVFLEN